MRAIEAWLFSILMPKLVALGFTPAMSKSAVSILSERTGSRVGYTAACVLLHMFSLRAP